MTAALISQDKPFKGTWKGRPGVVYTYHYDAAKFGKRVTIRVWTDTGDIEIRAIKGDARDPAKFKLFEENFRSAGQFNRDVIAQELANKHFA